MDAYVRHRLLEWREGHKTDAEFAQRGALYPSAVSQVRTGKLGIGAKTLPQFAKALGMSSSELLAVSEKWYAEHGHPARAAFHEARREPGIAEAIEVVKSLQGATEAQLQAIVTAYGAERFRGRDKAWWVQTLLSEFERDRRGQVIPRAEERQAAGKRAAHRQLLREREAAERASRPPPAKRKGVG